MVTPTTTHICFAANRFDSAFRRTRYLHRPLKSIPQDVAVMLDLLYRPNVPAAEQAELRKRIGARIREDRRALKVSHNRLALYAKMSPSTLVDIEHGRKREGTKSRTLHLARRVADLYRILANPPKRTLLRRAIQRQEQWWLEGMEDA